MSDLRDLYQEVIIDHSRHPRNFGRLDQANHRAEGYNPLCGDKLTVYLKMDDGVIRDLGFEGEGCAISTAAASLMTEALKGKTEAEAEAMFAAFHALVTGETAPAAATLGKLEVLGGVREFPSRVKCATLAWHTLSAALRDQSGIVTTEDNL
ncbi:Iron-sulfur cluster assembly scaffold protein IscU [Georgfuchsia toluolica]|uniref:Iron-sulfur cluster assembly scaffold protein IscU n=1 Tax=Georgfuchsia toluolica TaxID=424218 RepID=A0A916J1W8_9PROT|nr:SUF system NifU family Fe-S cluster assembly protein [Georgfuchsia toluolica]CAG4882462.1 Iron-sulfur cluster assembly scaffold protein IscU [Georgfuchsia toluolica]